MSSRLLPGYRVKVARKSNYDHWQGGPAYHEGAACTKCKRALLLLWDFNAKDPRFVVDGRPLFKSLKRLPLYYCWTCVSDIDYRVVAPDRIEVLKMEGRRQGKDFPYKNFPLEFPKQPIVLQRLSTLPQAIKKSVGTRWIDNVPAPGNKLLSHWLGRKVSRGCDIWWHQFGGRFQPIQGDEVFQCPIPHCSRHRQKEPMQIFATLHNDPPSGLPMTQTMKDVEENKGHFDRYVEVIYHICPECLAIHVGNRCD